MPTSFELPVTYGGKACLFPAELQVVGFTYRIKVIIESLPVFFEPDEEGRYRAVVEPGQVNQARQLHPALLENVCRTLETLFL